MVMTPWGDSASLRDRQLRPGPGTPAEEVSRNQRERLYAAMVACVAERGFAATTIEGLVELSGVSRRSFYSSFDDKAGCLRAAIEEILKRALIRLDVGDGAEGLEAESSRRFQVLAELAAVQPAAAKVCLNEAFAAGPEAVEPMAAAIDAYEKLFRRTSEASPDRAGMPEGLIRGRVGGVLEIIRARLRSGTQAELSALAPAIVALTMADRPPPEPLRLSVRPPKSRPESLDAADHAERAIRAFATLAAERGYPNVKIEDVVRLASMSTATFYANFASKDDLMAAAIDSACAQALAAVVPAFNRHAAWPDAMRAGFGALFNFLASRPALAKLVTVEVYAAGDAAIERRAAAIAPLGALIENNTTMWGTMPAVVYEMIAGGVAHLLHDAVSRSGTEALPGLAPLCTYLTLLPFLGPEDACRAANGDGGGRGNAEARPGWATRSVSAGETIGLAEPMRLGPWKVISMATTEPVTVAALAAAVDDDEATVSAQVKQLEATGMLRKVGERDGEPLYLAPAPTHPLNIISERQLAAMEVGERNELMAFTWRYIRADVDRATEQGVFGKQPDSFLTRTPMWVDQQGWRELKTVHEQALAAGLEAAERSRRRLEESDERGFEVRSMQIAFETEKKRP